VIVTAQLAQLGAFGAVRSTMRRTGLDSVAGLRWAQVAMLAPLAANRPPPIGPVALIAFWDDEATAERFVETHPVGRRFAGGLRAHLRPLRAYGSWPGLSDEVPTSRAVPHDGPVVVLTLARTRGSQAIRFARAGRPAEKAATEHDGMLWGTAAFRLPFLATMSIWRSSEASAAYAYGQADARHFAAMAEQRRKEFHHGSAFIRFAPTRLDGALGGTNPIDASAITI
jgi:hypothetical protein